MGGERGQGIGGGYGERHGHVANWLDTSIQCCASQKQPMAHLHQLCAIVLLFSSFLWLVLTLTASLLPLPWCCAVPYVPPDHPVNAGD